MAKVQQVQRVFLKVKHANKNIPTLQPDPSIKNVKASSEKLTLKKANHKRGEDSSDEQTEARDKVVGQSDSYKQLKSLSYLTKPQRSRMTPDTPSLAHDSSQLSSKRYQAISAAT